MKYASSQQQDLFAPSVFHRASISHAVAYCCTGEYTNNINRRLHLCRCSKSSRVLSISNDPNTISGLPRMRGIHCEQLRHSPPTGACLGIKRQDTSIPVRFETPPATQDGAFANSGQSIAVGMICQQRVMHVVCCDVRRKETRTKPQQKHGAD